MDEDNLIYPPQFLPKIQDFFLTELLMESYMSHSEILEVSRQLGYAVEERSFFCTVFTPVNLVQELVVAQGKSRYTLLHDAARKLGQYCGECSDMDFQMILAVLGREIVLLLSVPFGKAHSFHNMSNVSGISWKKCEQCRKYRWFSVQRPAHPAISTPFRMDTIRHGNFQAL